ncbi:LCP family protein, partial [Candidatus Saccharibacteria bacterium]|nr:LCP family protein [Candidatus Saccharibacteria bacterium]
MARKKKVVKIIIWVVVAILVLLAAVALRYWLAFSGFLDKITGRGPEMKEYSVLVKEDSSANEIGDLAGKNVSFLETDPKVANTEQHLKEIVNIETAYYHDVNMMVEMLNNGITDAVVLETDRIEILKEAAAEAVEKTRVLYTFEIEVESEDMELIEKEITTEPFIVYISGSDSRNGVKATARSDVNIVAVVNPKEEKILLVSIPRDTYVQLHDTYDTKDKLTHAGVYGINMSKTTIEDFLGIQIDYTIKVSFETVVKVVDQIDGIEIDSDTAMTIKNEGGKRCEIRVGKQKLDGDCALRFARERKSYASGDRHRGENQQQVITAIIGKLSKSKDYVLKIPTILDIAADSFETSFTRD